MPLAAYRISLFVIRDPFVLWLIRLPAKPWKMKANESYRCEGAMATRFDLQCAAGTDLVQGQLLALFEIKIRRPGKKRLFAPSDDHVK